jgi:DNA modification methylase
LWSNPGDLVLSPFGGIGSEGHVSLQMGRRYLGIELKRSYFDQAVKNLRQATAQQDAFELA